MRITIAALAVGALTVASNAQQIINFPGFADTTGLTLSGSANVLTTGDGSVIRLASQGQLSGSVFSSIPISTTIFQSTFRSGSATPAAFPMGLKSVPTASHS